MSRSTDSAFPFTCSGAQAALSTIYCVEQIPVGQMSVDQMVFGQKTWNGGDIVTLGRFCFCLLCSTKKLQKMLQLLPEFNL